MHKILGKMYANVNSLTAAVSVGKAETFSLSAYLYLHSLEVWMQVTEHPTTVA